MIGKRSSIPLATILTRIRRLIAVTKAATSGRLKSTNGEGRLVCASAAQYPVMNELSVTNHGFVSLLRLRGSQRRIHHGTAIAGEALARFGVHAGLAVPNQPSRPRPSDHKCGVGSGGVTFCVPQAAPRCPLEPEAFGVPNFRPGVASASCEGECRDESSRK